MMRNGDCYGLAVRRQDNTIVACRRPWGAFLSSPALRRPFLRGFPILVETLCNGIRALNTSALLTGEEQSPLTKTQLFLTLCVATVFALALFVVAPHLLSLLMFWLEIGGNVEGVSFHVWDGVFKLAIFMGYLASISLLPEIRDVLRFHGAEHKTIHAFEKAETVTVQTAAVMSRFHPRCGTTFLLFVLSISILMHAFLVPPLLLCLPHVSELTRHLLAILFKVALIVPISCLSYELIHKSARLPAGRKAKLLQSPGLFLQRLTTKEPSSQHLEVALVALHEALEFNDRERIQVPDYQHLDAANSLAPT